MTTAAPTIWDVAARHGSEFPVTLSDQFAAWLDSPDGQHVYDEVVNRARTLRSRGWRHFGIAAIWEAIRYDWSVRVGPDAEGWKVNNNYRAFMARRVMADYPDLEGFFETRIQHAA